MDTGTSNDSNSGSMTSNKADLMVNQSSTITPDNEIDEIKNIKNLEMKSVENSTDDHINDIPIESPTDVMKCYENIDSDNADLKDTISFGGQQLQSYSCSRCRRLKKKCLRQMPKCSNCVASHYACEYIGRLPRRSKKELKAAMLRGEFNPKKKKLTITNDKKDRKMIRKNDNMTLSKNNSSSNLQSDSTPFSDMHANQPANNMNNPEHSYTPNSMSDNMLDTSIKTLSGTNLQNQMEGISSLISALNSDFIPKNTSSSNTLMTAAGNIEKGLSNIFSVENMDNLNNDNSNVKNNTFLYANSGNTISKFSKDNPNLPLDQLSTLPVPSFTNLISNNNDNNGSTTKLTNPLVLNFGTRAGSGIRNQLSNNKINNNKAYNEKISTFNVEMIDSTPITDSAIQVETISSVFQGAKDTPWVTEDHSFRAVDRSLYDRFIAAYFNHNHRTFPMIDKIAFLNSVSTIRDFTQMDGQYSETFIFKLNMIMAIGCTTLHRAGMLSKDQELLSEHFAYLAMKKFSAVVKLQNIDTVICLLLLGVYSFFEPKGVSSWTISGIIMRLVIALGLNRSLTQTKLRQMSVADVEIRNRIFWSAYCYERLVSTSLGKMSAISDDSINVPPPRALIQEEESDIEVTLMTITLRRLSGRIYNKIHSVAAVKHDYSPQEKLQLIADLRKEIDDTYTEQRAKIQQKKTANYSMAYFNSEMIGDDHDMISFNSSDIWLAMRYSQFQIMLYRPSALIPKPSLESLTILGEFCLKALKFTYILYKKKMLPLNWITLFRALSICNTMLYCLCQWSIDITESKKEIQQCVDILQHFGEKWVFAKNCAEVFQNISNTIIDISLSNGQVPNMDKLTRELFGASDEYKDILDENNVDIAWNDRFP
ncbi:hypothetical protein TPHA_0H01240 [Tetrapisispora phaffii CBS 4417]|uniref:Zn(2)-C6 fungal-type domain-containing protein n=1 Tax=Tetrapisispora phaffii (strain ATCC 24235 / CBS 4417 / NBRC 1672 / NRRL Y-8282 / UCD 70-5) TaxID=1071381 RepID=G8BX28_TETPH|nr:hypothetical protein TPHA_0H01240 [Tetrapisispora phaffii CBS 4417]CCE64332.1 hypothetical protein TPHA_0H01240 [Tetrapisispora phaffii CBS 4417]